MVEWPNEIQRRLNPSQKIRQLEFDLSDERIEELQSREAFATLVQGVLHAAQSKTDPRIALEQLTSLADLPLAYRDYEDKSREVVLALASVAALQRVPTREMWEYLWSLRYNSWVLEAFLPGAVIRMARADASFRQLFFTLAHDVMRDAAANPGRRAIKKEKGTASSARAHWRKHRQLSTLWRGNFSHSFGAIEGDDDGVLSIAAELDIAEFVKLLINCDFPDPIAHALFWCGAASRFELWKSILAEAPAAFDDLGEWNGSLILPILLAVAQHESHTKFFHRPTPLTVSEETDAIRSLAAGIAQAINTRIDAVGCTNRWGTWLIRSAIPAISTNRSAQPADASSHGFVDAALHDALIAELSPGGCSQEPIPGEELWEPWCHIMSLVLAALSGKASMPSPSRFLEEWCLSCDEWSKERGQRLWTHSSVLQGEQQRADGYGSRLLALPLVESKNADEVWTGFWRNTVAVREIVEFGDPGDDPAAGWEGRRKAADLVKIQFSLGLMMLDHLILPQPGRSVPYERKQSLSQLLAYLDQAAMEMTATDPLNAKFWSEALRHLAIRRVVWLSGPEPDRVELGEATEPTFANFIRKLAGDTGALLDLVHVAANNGVHKTVLLNALTEAGVDIVAELGIAERLLDLSPKALTLGPPQLAGMRQTLGLPPRS